MKQAERDQVAQILQNYVAREYSPDNPQRDFYEGLVESWRKTGTAGTGSLDRDAFNYIVAEALE